MSHGGLPGHSPAVYFFFLREREREFESYYLASDLIRDFERGILSRRNLMTALLYGLFLNDLQ